MRSITKHIGRILSVLLASAMLVTSVPQSVLTTDAAELSGSDSTLSPAITATENTDAAGLAALDKETDPGSDKETAPAEILPEGSAPEDGQTDETAPESTAPDDSLPEITITPPADIPPEGTTPEGNIPGGTAPEENGPEDTAPEGSTPKDSLPPTTEPGTETPEESTPEETLPADTVQEETVSENTVSENTAVVQEQETEPRADAPGIHASNVNPDNPSVTWTLYTNGELVVEGTGEIIIKEENFEYNSDSRAPWYDYHEEILSATVRVTGATTAWGLFKDCTKLETVDLKEFDTSKVTDMSYMFRSCSSLKEIDVSTFDTSNVTSICGMFDGCTSLTKLDLSSFDTSKVTNMGYLVEYCSSLKEINVSSFDTTNARYLIRMFNYCPSLETLDLSSFVIGYQFNGGYIDVENMVNCGPKLREIKTPKEITNPYTTIRLPWTPDFCSWRAPDGTRISSFDKKLEGGITLSTGSHAGIRFKGAHYTLAEYPETTIEDIEKVFPKGSKEGFTFTIVPDEGYTVTPTVASEFDTVKITRTQDGNPYQYTVTPKDPEQGYVQDEIITVTVATPATNPVEIEYYNWSIADYFVVANGKKLAEYADHEDNLPISRPVDNNYDITVYAKPLAPSEGSNADYLLPAVDLTTLEANGTYVQHTFYSETNADSLTAEEKEFSEGGYYVVRLGRIYRKAEIEIWGREMYRVKLMMKGFPENAQIVRYVKKDYDSYYVYEEQICGEEIEIGSDEGDLLIQPRWDDSSGAHKWCRLQVLHKRVDDSADDYFPATTYTIDGISGDVWRLDPSNGYKAVLIELAPHKIELSYPDGDITNLTANTEGIQFSEDLHTIEVHNGDSFSISFTLNEELTMKGISVEGNGETEGIASLKDEGEGRWTITVNDLASRLYDIAKININAEDPKNRLSLADPNNHVQVEYKENKKKPLAYRNEPITLDKMSVTIFYTESTTGRRRFRTLDSSDYTAVYSDNINAGQATLTITAKPDSTKCRGQYVYHFTIRKAKSFVLPDTSVNVDVESPQTDLSELSFEGTYDKNVKPVGGELFSCDKGGILSADPVINGTTITYSIRKDADINSAPAQITINTFFDNYENNHLKLSLHLVKRDTLVLGGSLANDKVYDSMEFVPNPEGLQVISKNGAAPSAEETAAILDSIKGTLSYRYAGTEGTMYDSETPPVTVGTYKLQAMVSRDNTLYKSDWNDVGTFKITQREAVFTAKDVTRYVNDTIPASYEYDYAVEGLVIGDTVNGAPVLTSDIQSTETVANYPIHVALVDPTNKLLVQIINANGKDVTANYHITGREGTLHIEEPKQGSCTVIYCLSGKGTDIRRSGIAAGSTLPRPADPVVKGFKFLGWYLDETLAKTWNFAVDTIQGDITLYAGWSQDLSTDPYDGMQIYVQEILPQTYTGKALKPAVTVFAADGKTVLKNNTDYSVTYKNNTDADTKKFSSQATIPAGGIGSGESDTSKGFDSRLAYAIITGKGNYTGTIYMNFHISPVALSDVSNPASGITLKYTESFEEKSGKTAAIVTQLKTKTARLKYGTDYTLTVNKAADGSAVTLNEKGQLPLNSGTYNLTITGKDNYAGSIEKELYVAAKSQLIKNAKITCTGTIADVSKEQLTAGVEAQNLQVSMAGSTLTKDTDYTVTYTDNKAIGTATVTVKGINGYFGSKSATFKIKGIAFKETEFGTVALQDMTYTGAPLTQNDVVLSKNGKPLIYGEDYTISYKNNVKKGTAAVTFTAKPSSGYSGSFKKTFKINPLNLDSSDILLQGAQKNDGSSRWTLTESVPYQKGGSTPSDKLKLQLSKTGAFLTAGKDYTIKYKDNTEISEGKACMTLTGKGNFAGSLTVYFDIRKASLSALYEAGAVSVTPRAVRATFPKRWSSEIEDYELIDCDYEPAITIKHGKQTLKQGTDYEVSYSGNSRGALENGGGTPEASISGIGNYAGLLGERDESFTIPLSIYQYSLSSGTVYVVYDESTEFSDTGEPISSYTGEQICPKIKAIYYGKAADISKAKREQETNEYLLTEEKTLPSRDNPNPDYAYGLTKLQEYKDGAGDYILSYGPNTAKGKNGKVIVSGVYNYSGKATSTFTIYPKDIYPFSLDE